MISGKLSLPSLEKMTSEYEAEKAEFNVLNDVASRVRSQGRYVNRLADLTGAVKNGDQCGKFKKCKRDSSNIQGFCQKLSDYLIQKFK